jgi:MoaA/NifB/PqqE/SkfB family radical SAM enzyme
MMNWARSHGKDDRAGHQANREPDMRGLTFKRTLEMLPNVGRRWFSYRPGRRKSSLRGPGAIQVQTVDRCNGACIMCPYSTAAHVGPMRRMDERLYLRILEQARKAGATRALIPMLQNEPLLDRDLGKRVQQAKIVLGPSTRVPVVTNGSLLTPARADELIGHGADHFEVSIDACRRETYETIRPGLDFGKVIEHTQALIRHQRRPGVIARFLRQRANEGEEREFVRYWRSRGAQTRVMGVSNRAGEVEGFESLAGSGRKPLTTRARAAMGRFLPPCALPFISMSVLWDGRVILCCQDWGPRDVVGDLTKQSVAEVWNGEAMNHYRHLLYQRRWERGRVCRDCSVVNGAGAPSD